MAKTSCEQVSAENKEIIICGDFNCPLNNPTVDSNTKKLKSLLCSNGLSQIIESPTRVTKDSLSLSDLMITNVPDNIIKHSVIPLGLSDHDFVLCVRKINGIKFAPRIIHCRNYRNYSADKLCTSLRQERWDFMSSFSDVNKAWLYFKEKFITICNKHAPSVIKRVRGINHPWLTNKVKKLMNERDCVLKKARHTNKEIFWSEYKTLRNRVNNTIKIEKANFSR